MLFCVLSFTSKRVCGRGAAYKWMMEHQFVREMRFVVAQIDHETIGRFVDGKRADYFLANTHILTIKTNERVKLCAYIYF